MKKNIFTFILAGLSVCTAFGQQPAETYKFSEDIYAETEKDTVAWKYQTAAVHYSFTGQHDKMLNAWDKAIPPRTYTPTSSDSAFLKNAVIQNAKDYIINRSEKEKIIIINEAHHYPKHRVFTGSLLEGLYKNGYRYLGLEALSDAAVNDRNYAVQESGFYTSEPQFGNLIYEAKKLGFTVFGYEASEGKNGKEREIEQAGNIQKFMKSHPDGKYIIHCGFDHVYEKEVRSWEKAMAGRLKEYTGIDPFTIDQVKFSEKSRPESGHYFVYATPEREAFVLLNQDNEVFNGFAEPRQTDVLVIHPVTNYKKGRPDWLSAGKTAYYLPESKQKNYTFPLQVLAYRIGEFENKGIPSDIIELHTGQHDMPLYLQKGNYKIVVRNNRYNIQDTFLISIEK